MALTVATCSNDGTGGTTKDGANDAMEINGFDTTGLDMGSAGGKGVGSAAAR